MMVVVILGLGVLLSLLGSLLASISLSLCDHFPLQTFELFLVFPLLLGQTGVVDAADKVDGGDAAVGLEQIAEVILGGVNRDVEDKEGAVLGRFWVGFGGFVLLEVKIVDNVLVGGRSGGEGGHVNGEDVEVGDLVQRGGCG